MNAFKDLSKTRAPEVLTLREYIDKYHERSQLDFAYAFETSPQQVSRWIKRDILMVNGSMYARVIINKKVDILDEVN